MTGLFQVPTGAQRRGGLTIVSGRGGGSDRAQSVRACVCLPSVSPPGGLFKTSASASRCMFTHHYCPLSFPTVVSFLLRALNKAAERAALVGGEGRKDSVWSSVRGRRQRCRGGRQQENTRVCADGRRLTAFVFWWPRLWDKPAPRAARFAQEQLKVCHNWSILWKRQLVVSLTVVPNAYFFFFLLIPFFMFLQNSLHSYYHQQSTFGEIVDQSLETTFEIQFLPNKDTKHRK